VNSNKTRVGRTNGWTGTPSASTIRVDDYGEDRTRKLSSDLPEQFFESVQWSAIGFDDVQARDEFVEREHFVHFERRSGNKPQSASRNITAAYYCRMVNENERKNRPLIIGRIVINVKAVRCFVVFGKSCLDIFSFSTNEIRNILRHSDRRRRYASRTEWSIRLRTRNICADYLIFSNVVDAANRWRHVNTVTFVRP